MKLKFNVNFNASFANNKSLDRDNKNSFREGNKKSKMKRKCSNMSQPVKKKRKSRITTITMKKKSF